MEHGPTRDLVNKVTSAGSKVLVESKLLSPVSEVNQICADENAETKRAPLASPSVKSGGCSCGEAGVSGLCALTGLLDPLTGTI